MTPYEAMVQTNHRILLCEGRNGKTVARLWRTCFANADGILIKFPISPLTNAGEYDIVKTPEKFRDITISRKRRRSVMRNVNMFSDICVACAVTAA